MRKADDQPKSFKCARMPATSSKEDYNTVEKGTELDKAEEERIRDPHENIDRRIKDMRTRIAQSILSYEPELASKVVEEALEKGMRPMEIMDSLTRGMRLVGEQFQKGEAFVFNLAIAAEAMNAAVAILKPFMKKQKAAVKKLGTFVIGTVEGDIHDIGKNIVASMLQASGFEVFDLGKDVPVQRFVNAVRETNADIVGVSALLSTTRLKQKELVEALVKEGLRDKVKIMVGGAVVNEQWAKEIGADGYGRNAVDAVDIAKKLVSKSGG